MSLQRWMETRIASKVSGPQLSNVVSATSLLFAAAKDVLPANFFEPGKQLQIKATGNISCVVTTPGTLQLSVRLGSVVAFLSSAMALNVVAKTNVPFDLDLLLTCLTEGAGTSATLIGTGRFTSEALVGSPLPAVGGAGVFLMPVTTPAAGTGFDSSAAQILDLFGQFSVATSPTNITVQQYSVISPN